MYINDLTVLIDLCLNNTHVNAPYPSPAGVGHPGPHVPAHHPTQVPQDPRRPPGYPLLQHLQDRRRGNRPDGRPQPQAQVGPSVGFFKYFITPADLKCISVLYILILLFSRGIKTYTHLMLSNIPVYKIEVF